MMELWAIPAGIELGKVVLTQVLGFTTAALESYVEDFFKGCLTSGVARLKASTLKQPMAEAIGFFLQRFIQELKDNEVPDTSINHFYRDAAKQFVKDVNVRPLLGQAFVDGNATVDAARLKQIWEETYLNPQWGFPVEDFRWRRITQKYQEAVVGIIEADADLREVLNIQLQKRQTESLKQLAGRTVGFDLTRYRNAILEQYGALKLESLGSSQYEREGTNYRSLSLWDVFVAQEARECQEYLPQAYEIPKEHLRRYQQAGMLDDLAEAEVERRRDFYRQAVPESVLAIVGATADLVPVQPRHPYLVILGDPGSGKSTLLRYLAVQWARQGTEAQIPLLIELRGYSQSREKGECQDFIDFVHRGSNWVNHLDQHQLEDWLTQGKALVMLDGLDEVVDRQQRGTVLTQIHNFTQRYPQVPVVVTSRIIGYRAEALREAGFHHFMLQDLEEAQIADFLQRWHDLTYRDEAERQRKRERLNAAITRSKAIRELAGNPLLLTLMAILNRGEELPRDRTRLYEKASEVLLYQWDVEEKLLKDARLEKYPIELDHRDKQRMLRRVAARMQTSPKGLAGNFIRHQDLLDCLTDYLKTIKEAPNAPSIATLIIDQLRERNFILCYLGDDAYAFVHRTFLEYFCAAEIKERFDKRGAEGGLTFEQLRDQVFAPHWQDATWHEVLRLVTGMVDPEFAEGLIQWVMAQTINRAEHLDEDSDLLEKSGLLNLLLAADCLGEVRDRATLTALDTDLLQQLQTEVEQEYPYNFTLEAAEAMVGAIVAHWPDHPPLPPWLERCVVFSTASYSSVPVAAVGAIATLKAGQPQTLIWLKTCAQTDKNWAVRVTAVSELAQGWKDDPDTLPWLKSYAQSDEHWAVRSTAMSELARGWKDDPDTLPILKNCAQTDEDLNVRSTAVKELAQGWKDDPDTLPWLKSRAQRDENEYVRRTAVKELAQGWGAVPELFECFHSVTLNDPFERKESWQDNPRQIALKVLITHHRHQPQTLDLLRDKATHDPDEQLRQWAQDQLEHLEIQNALLAGRSSTESKSEEDA